MKKTICVWLVHFILGGLAIQAQQSGHVHVIPKSITQEGDMLEVEMLFDMRTLRLRSEEFVTYTPIITGSEQQYELPKVIIKGSSRYKADLRKETLTNNPTITVLSQGRDKNYPIYSVVKFNKREQVPYRIAVPFRTWMSDASIMMREETCGCGNAQLKMTQWEIIFDDEGYDIQPRFNYIVPDGEPEKNRFDIGNAFLEFSSGGSTINPGFRNNQRELDKINQLISILSSDPDVKVTSIEMRGYASPEGTASSNYALSSQRATAMRDYFVRRLPNIPSSSFLTGVGGEDWEGLKILLTNYSVAQKDEILQIINTVQDFDTREQRIKSLGNGEPYRQLFHDLYPQLRRVDCQINYTARNFTVEEGKARIEAKPKLLSQNEMYQVAQTYPTGSSEFTHTLIAAQQYFPQNDIANLNAAAAALTEGNYAAAEEYLKQIQNTGSGEYANCMGVLCMFRGDYAAAEEHLLKARVAGIAEATHNLQILAKKRNQY